MILFVKTNGRQEWRRTTNSIENMIQNENHKHLCIRIKVFSSKYERQTYIQNNLPLRCISMKHLPLPWYRIMWTEWKNKVILCIEWTKWNEMNRSCKTKTEQKKPKTKSRWWIKKIYIIKFFILRHEIVRHSCVILTPQSYKT